MKTLKPEEVFDYLKPEWNYIAMDGKNTWHAFTIQPNCSPDHGGVWFYDADEYCLSMVMLNIEWEGDWKGSLHCRVPKYAPLVAVHHEDPLLTKLKSIEKSIDDINSLLVKHSRWIGKLEKIFSVYEELKFRMDGLEK